MILPFLKIKKAGKKGRGVFTLKPIAAGTVVEVAPVVVLSASDRQKLETTALYYYVFEWGNDQLSGALALGYVSIYNHASPSNCEYTMSYRAKTITVTAMRDIAAGEELTLNYSAGWDDWKPVWFDVKDD